MNQTNEIRKQLYRIARTQNIAYDLTLLNYMQERFLYRVSQSPYKENFILKGGVLMRSIEHILPRPTRDLDFLVRNVQNVENIILGSLQSIFNIQENDGLVFDLSTLKIEISQFNLNYPGFTASIVCSLGKSKNTLNFDLGFSDIVIPQPTLIQFPSILGMEPIQIFGYNVNTIIAEKIDTIFDRGSTNTRVKDFYDLYLLITSQMISGSNFFEVLKKVLTHRDRSILLSNIEVFGNLLNNSQFSQNWSKYLSQINVDIIDITRIIEIIRSFTIPVYQTLVSGKEFLLNWDINQLKWV